MVGIEPGTSGAISPAPIFGIWILFHLPRIFFKLFLSCSLVCAFVSLRSGLPVDPGLTVTLPGLQVLGQQASPTKQTPS